MLRGVPCSSGRLSPATRPNASDTATNKMRRTCHKIFKNVTFTISLKYTKIQVPRLSQWLLREHSVLAFHNTRILKYHWLQILNSNTLIPVGLTPNWVKVKTKPRGPIIFAHFPFLTRYMFGDHLFKWFIYFSHSVLSNSLQSHGLKPTRLLFPRNSTSKNTGVGCHSLLQRIFPTQGSNLGLLHCRQILYLLSHKGSLIYLKVSQNSEIMNYLISRKQGFWSWENSEDISVQFSSVAQSCPTLCNPMNRSMPGLPVHHQLPSPPKSMSVKSVIPSNHLILCRPLLLLPSIFPSIRVFSSELALRIRWLKYWSFSFNISPSNEHLGLISFKMDWLDLLTVQGTLKSLLQHHSSKASILQHSAFFIVQLSHLEKP